MLKTNQPLIQNNEIDLRELWQILAKQKYMIILITLLFTTGAVLYVWMTKPVYSGDVLIEIGEVVNSNEIIRNNDKKNNLTTIFNLDDVNNLKKIVEQKTGLSVDVPKETSNILHISMETSNINEIKSSLENTIDFILARHQEKAELYQNTDTKIRMTQIVGEIKVNNDPIKPKKVLIVSVGFISGLMLGIFGAFFREFIMRTRNDK